MNMKLTFCTALLTAATLLAPVSVAAEKAQDPTGVQRSAVEMYGRLPLSFEPTDSAARFLARSGSYAVSIGARQSFVAVTDAKSGKRQALSFAFDQANAAAGLEALEVQPGVTNYYIGVDAAKWRLGVNSYAKLRTKSLYPGVDVVYYGDHRRLEFDFVVAPKADAGAIALTFAGMEKLYKDGNGDLVAELNGQPVRFAKPYAYQRDGGVVKPVEADYELAAGGSVHLRVGRYDPSMELTIDPAVTYATYLGGSQGDVGNGIAVDSTGAAYVTGQTCSSDFPDIPNPSGYVYTSNCDAYVTKYSADGTAYVYTTIIGGSNPYGATATGNAIALDSSNQVYITGWTNFEDLPGIVSQYRSSYQGGDSDAFVTILTASGTMLRATYLGGGKADIGYGIAVDRNNSVIVVGQTNSGDFPAYNGFETKVEDWVAFNTKLDNGLHIAPPAGPGASAITPPPAPVISGATYYFSEFFGGQKVPPAPTYAWAPSTYMLPGTIVQDDLTPIPNIQITWGGGTTGGAEPAWTPTVLAYTTDNTVTWQNLGPTQGFPTYASEAYGVALDPIGDVFVAGGTNTANIASTVWPFMFITFQGTGAWVLKVSGQNGAFIYGTPLETTTTDLTSTVNTARAIAVDSAGSAYVAGTATGTLYTTANAYQQDVRGTQNAFLVKINNSGSAFEYSTYLGGSTGKDQGLGVAVDGSFSPYLTGATKSTDFPVINPVTNPNSGLPLTALDGAQDAFITKFTADGSALILSAYLGGSNIDQGNAIAVDSHNLGNIYVAGTTNSADFETTLLQQPTVSVPTPPYAPPQTTYGGGSSDAFVALLSGASLPTVTVTPGSLSFADQDVGTPSAPQAVQYTNTSTTSTVTISSILFTGSTAFAQSIQGGTPGDCFSGPVKPNTACNIWVVFTPTATGQATGTLSITDNASTASHDISLGGEGAVPLDVLTPSSLTFGSQAVNTTSPVALTATLKNEASVGTLNIASIATTGDFSQTNNCGGQVAPSASCTINVLFTPTLAGTRTGTLTVTDNSLRGSNTVILTGIGVEVTSSVTPATLTFPAQAINVVSAAQTVTVKNTYAGTPAQTLLLNAPTITGDYQISNNGCTVPLAPAESCTIQVVYDPTAPGLRTGTLTITGNGNPMPATVALTGTAGATSKLTPSTTLTFNPTNEGQTTSLPVTLSNQSNFPFNVLSIAISGAAAGDFTQANDCGSSVSALGSCTITVTFAPTAMGNRNGTLTVTTDAATSPQSVGLLGSGTAPSVTLVPATNYTFPNQPLNTASAAASGQIKLQNTGTGPLNIPNGGITIAGTNAGDFTQTNNCGSQVAAGASCTISVVFTPSALNSRSATLTIADNAVPATQSIALLGTGVLVSTPVITPANLSLTFGNQPLNVASGPKTVMVSNYNPTYPLTLSTPVTTGNFQVVTVSGTGQFNCTTVVAVGSSCVIGVTFTPLTPGAQSGTLTIASNGTAVPVVVQLSGTGGAVASVNPTSLSLGSANLTESTASMSVTLKNSSSFAVNITSVTTSGPSASQFAVSNLCGTIVPASPGQCNIDVTFNPTATGIQTAELNIVSDAATPFAPVALSGTGTQPQVTLTPTSVTFPSPGQALNVASSPIPVTLKNTGTGPLNFAVQGITITGTNSGDFGILTTTCGSLVAVGASCVVNVVFTPTALNSRSANLVFTDDASPTTQTVPLLGTGIAGAGVIELSPASLAFVSTAVNTPTAAKTVTVTNASSSSALTLSSIAVVGTSDFAISTNNCPLSPSSLAASGTCQIGLTYTPSTSAIEIASLSVVGSASNSPQSVALSGSVQSNPNTAPFSVTPDSTGVSVAQGNTAQYTLSVAPLNNFTGSIQFSCPAATSSSPGLPAGAACSFSPATLVMDGTTTKTVTLLVSTNGSSASARPDRMIPKSIFLALLPFSLMGILLINNKRRCVWFVVGLVGLCLLLGMVGCGSGSSKSTNGDVPTGSHTFTVTATSTTNAAQTESFTLTLVVTPQ
jgi:hypothetical protein